jgi:hypothetical protein
MLERAGQRFVTAASENGRGDVLVVRLKRGQTFVVSGHRVVDAALVPQCELVSAEKVA